MSNGINQVLLMGNLGADPEVKQTSAGLVCKFRIATTRTWIDKNTSLKKEDTEWHRIVVFGNRAEPLGRLLKKGERVFVTGRIHNSSYEKDGVKKYSTEIIADDVQFMGGPRPPQTGASDGLSEGAMPPPSTSNGGFNRRPAESFDQLPF